MLGTRFLHCDCTCAMVGMRGEILLDDQKDIHPEVAPFYWLQDVWKPGGGRWGLGTATLCLRKHPVEGWLFFH